MISRFFSRIFSALSFTRLTFPNIDFRFPAFAIFQTLFAALFDNFAVKVFEFGGTGNPLLAPTPPPKLLFLSHNHFHLVTHLVTHLLGHPEKYEP